MALADLATRIDATRPPERQGISLSMFMDSVSNRVKTVPAAWVVAEIAQAKDSRHLYLELVEHSDEGSELAKCRAVIWAGKKAAVVGRFQQATGGQLRSGMKLMVYASPSFHAQYGFSLVIENIDPTYTLGDMQRKLNEIKERLNREGVIDQNRKLERPSEFSRVAVIAPDEAAGLGDFKATATWLEKYKLCQFEYFTALFQGNAVSSSLCTAIHTVQTRHQSNPFDAIVIIRGGGAVTDLAQLNEYQVAKSVCMLEVPVLSGIGHEKDSTIIDEVSNERFDTPSKVIAHIMDTIVHNARNAEKNWQQVWNGWERINTSSSYALDTRMDQIANGVRGKLQRVGSDMEFLHEQVVHHSRRIVEAYPKELDFMMSEVTAKAKANLQHSRQVIESNMERVEDGARLQLLNVQRETKRLMEYIAGMGPRQTLKRGYAIIRSQGKIIVTAEQAKACHNVDIEFNDGTVEFKRENKV